VDSATTALNLAAPYIALGLALFLLVGLFLRGRTSRKRAEPSARAGPAAVSEGAATVAPPPDTAPPIPRIVYDDVDDENDEAATIVPPTAIEGTATKIFYEEDAALDEPTAAQPLIALSATAETDRGLRRRRNEDRVLALEHLGIFAVADGMGGVRGGELASTIAIDTLRDAFENHRFDGEAQPNLPRRAAELERAIAMANEAILARSRAQRELRGMGTTISAARFAAQKQRLYIGHVGDSRIYRLRGGRITQMTSDHTMEGLGVEGEEAKNLSRALGVWPRVPVDIICAKPLGGDVYLLCSDGLTKMVEESRIAMILVEGGSIHQSARALVDAANASGGKDNISVVIVRIDEPRALAMGA
jgi:serine/threonine protein phosphatase PrpC